MFAKPSDSKQATNTMGRSPCCDESGLKKGPWTPDEDQKLLSYIHKHGHGSWRALPKLAGLNRCGKSCRLRWTNYLRPDIKRGKFSPEEEQTILHLHSILGNKWSTIATHLPGRTDNEIKNLWNTHLKKRLIQMGLDPMTHKPRSDLLVSLPHLIALAKELLDHRPWADDHMARLQAEALRSANLQFLQPLLHSTTAMGGGNSYNLTSSVSPSIPSAPSQALNGQTHVFYSPELQIPCSSEITNQNYSSLFSPSSIPPLADALTRDPGNACSNSNSGGSGVASFWPELFDDDTFASEFP